MLGLRRSGRVGGSLSVRVPEAAPETTVADLERMLWQRAQEFDIFDYVYVLDEKRRLLGAVSIREIFRLPKNVAVSSVMRSDLVSAESHWNLEWAACRAAARRLRVLPVTDRAGRFLGVLLPETILWIFYRRIFGGRPPDSVSPGRRLIGRALVLGLGSAATLALSVVLADSFSSLWAALALPLSVFETAAVGIQAKRAAVWFLRSAPSSPITRFRREFWLEVGLSFWLGLGVGLVSWFLVAGPILALALGAWLWLVSVVAVIGGLGLPFLWEWLGFEALALRDSWFVIGFGFLGAVLFFVFSAGQAPLVCDSFLC